ncbi:hypothetical protein LY28_03505 [Ruminiclostridium sufflavum DSM 19573]|uniref:Uncharacterized protein n=1 Tax=Ruminiclostridium sufflavum DSM 19573 TaxID=1121337 RepID=A0A318XSL9_9FIRM|nr:hypothetical protein [Ruminiclostridium sufflavum]PYG84884.1 hypothetical protein LY28_03505 [Ruminiclostridium sufflavum DSM 19573]
MERKLTKAEFIKLFRLQKKKAEKARKNSSRQDRDEEYNFCRQEKQYGIWYGKTC